MQHNGGNMKIVITGNQFEQVLEPTGEELASLRDRARLTVEIWNRDNPADQRQVMEAEVWPIPEPEPVPQE